MLSYDYTVRHNEVLCYIHLLLCNRFEIKRCAKLHSHLVQEPVSGPEATITVDTRIKTDVKIQHNRPEIVVHDKKRNEILLIEVGSTSQDRLITVETKKQHKYNLLAQGMR